MIKRLHLLLIFVILTTSSCYTYNKVQVDQNPKPFYYREYHYGHYYPKPPGSGKVIPSTPLPRQKKERHARQPKSY